jgi:gliding motility-associated-like protein
MKIRKISLFLVVIVFLPWTSAFAQAFINGDFENNTSPAGTNQVNLSNASYNAMMANSIAFGSYGDMDIITTAIYDGPPQSGSWYVAFTGGGSDAISLELTSPLVAGNSYTVSFWDRAPASWIPQPFQIGVSTTSASFGTTVYTAPTPVYSVWTNRIATFVAPVSGQYITVQLSGAYSLSDWAQVDNFSFVSSNSVTTGVISGSPFCACDSLTVPFTSTGSFNAGNTYTAQLSDAAGSFASPVDIGTLVSTANSGNISCGIPCSTLSGSQYRIRVVSSSPSLIGSDNGVDFAINTVLVPDVSITALPAGTICSGTSVTFTALATNGGSNPGYEWQVNGFDVGFNLSTYNSSTLNNGDVVTVILTSNASCAFPSTDTSNAIVMNVLSSVIPSVTISALPAGPICIGTPVAFTAVPVNGGSSPTYQWLVNGLNAGTNSPTYTTSTLSDGDVVSVILISNATCASPLSDTSNSLTISVDTIPVPVVSGDTILCSGFPVVLSASGGNAYVWSNSATTQSITVFPLVTTTYFVTVFNGACSASDDIIIGVKPLPVAEAGNDTTINSGNTVQLNGSGGMYYIWTPVTGLSCSDCPDPLATPGVTTTYYLQVTDSNGCYNSDAVTVYIIEQCGPIYLPNIFSPNGDGVNDLFFVRGDCIDEMSLIIYDRWGEKVFDSKDPNSGWDGNFRGKSLESGVFYYFFKATLKNEEVIRKSGSITLVK